MLIGIDPVLSPDLLHVLRAMGHGDTIVIADANFPATNTSNRLLRQDGIDASRVLRAILSVMPLDTYCDRPAVSMQVVGDPDTVPDAVADFQSIIETIANAPAKIVSVDRFAFYDMAKTAFAIIQTGERRFYGNLMLTKGVLAEF